MNYLKSKYEPREYQSAIASSVVNKGSSLIVLPTGLGKTYVAALIISKLMSKGKRVLFLAPTKPLTQQHLEYFKENLSLEISLITGEIKQKQRIEIIENSDMVIATPQTIKNDIPKIKHDFDIIVFDEAHRAAGNYAYIEIAKCYPQAFKIGLSASPGSSKAEIKEVMQNLDLNNVEVRTGTEDDISKYIKETDLIWIKVELEDEMKNLNKLLKEFVENLAKEVRKYGYALRHGFTQRELLYTQSKIFENLKTKNPYPTSYMAASSLAAMMKVEHAITLLETQGISALCEYLDRLFGEEDTSKARKRIVQDENIIKARQIAEGLKIANIEHPKIKMLEHLILDELDKNPESKIIVFNHYRDSVESLSRKLNENPLISAVRFVGQASKGSSSGLSQKEQKQIIDDFKENKYNVLLATSVAEEGLDIPSVDTVIFYEPVPSDIRSVQRRGRTGRFGKGKVYILITKGTRDEAFYHASKNKESSMKKSISELGRKETLNEKIKKIESEKEKPKEASEPKRQVLLTDILKKEEKKENVDKIRIFVDTRERNSKTYDYIKKKDAIIEEKALDIGDYLVSNESIIERKSASDFINSLLDGRLFEQAVKMTFFEKPMIIIEGDLSAELEDRNIRKEQIVGAVLSLMNEYKIAVISTVNYVETADIIYQMAKREQLKGDKIHALRRVKVSENLETMQRYVLEGLPFVGPTLAKRLIEKYGTLKKIFSLDEDKISSIEGIGEKKAKEIYRIINEINKDR